MTSSLSKTVTFALLAAVAIFSSTGLVNAGPITAIFTFFFLATIKLFLIPLLLIPPFGPIFSFVYVAVGFFIVKTALLAPIP